MAFQLEVGIHNNDTNGIMCSNSRQASGGGACPCTATNAVDADWLWLRDCSSAVDVDHWPVSMDGRGLISGSTHWNAKQYKCSERSNKNQAVVEAPQQLVCCRCGLSCHSSEGCGRMVATVTLGSSYFNVHSLPCIICIMTNPKLKMSHEGTARVWHFQPRVIVFECHTNDHASSVLSYDQPLV